ncbi:hypothetical protein F7725_018067 [Dissostichus mawsoni]|uniref:Uncharacterized protein n=1 Tax=Dissostichus mawsoni TaxID=36200 RepID=A0A7J5XQM4_DISMA|nr:hypothetical protein F7725_018067 [Dissostichus mawsoni]
MVLVQRLSKKPATVVTVKDLSGCFNDRLMSLTRDYDEIILVFDTYRTDSLKSATRDKRRQGKAIQYQVRDDTNIKHIPLSRSPKTPHDHPALKPDQLIVDNKLEQTTKPALIAFTMTKRQETAIFSSPQAPICITNQQQESIYYMLPTEVSILMNDGAGVEVDLVALDKGLVEGRELGLEVLGVRVQLFLQVLSIGGHHLFHQVGSLHQLHLDLLLHGGHALLEVLQVLVHLQLQVVGVGPELSLQGGSQGLGVKGFSVGGQLLFELLHSLLDLDLHVVGVGLQLAPDSAQLLGQNISQHISLCGLGRQGELLLQGDGILAGNVSCNANIFYADAPKPQMELITEAFWDYVIKATATADDTLQVIKKSPFGQSVNARLEETMFVAAHYSVAVQEQLPPAAKDMIRKVTTEAEELMGRVERELAVALKPYTDDMKVQIQQRVEQLKLELAPYAESLDTEALRATLEQKSEELKQSVNDLQAQLGPYTDDLKLKVDQHLQDFQERVAPVTEKARVELIQRANQVQEMAAPYVEDLKPQIELLTEAFWDYVAKATETADEIKKSQFVEHTGTYWPSIISTPCKTIFPAAMQNVHQVIRETEDLMKRMNRELPVALKPYTDDMKVQIQQRVEQLKQELAPYAESLDTEALRATLEQKSEELKQSVKDLQAQLGPYTDYLKLNVDQHVKDIQERMAQFIRCNANILYADAPKPQIELLTEAFHDYVAKAKETADDTLQMIKKSQFGKHVNARLGDGFMAAFYFASAVHEQLPPAAKDMIHKVTRETERVERELAAALKPYTNDMEVQIQQRVEQLKLELAPYAESLDTEALRATLEQKSEELKQSVKDLQAQLRPYTDDLKLKVDQHLQDFQERVAPVTEKAQVELIQRANQVQEMAAPYVEDLKVKLDPYAKESQPSGVSICPTTMKAVALIFALAVIAGCNARVVRQADATPQNWEETVDRFWQYVSDLNAKADGVVQDIKHSDLRQHGRVDRIQRNIQSKLAPYTESSTGQMSEDLQLLTNKLQKDMLDAKERSTEYLGELKTMMVQNTDDVRGRISTYTHKLKKRLNKDTDEIRNTVATYMGEIQSRTSQNLETVKENVEPYVQQASEVAGKKLSDISTILKSQAETLTEQLETQAAGIKTQLENTAQQLRTSLESKIDELTEMISPYTAQIREQIENIMLNVKEASA